MISIIIIMHYDYMLSNLEMIDEKILIPAKILSVGRVQFGSQWHLNPINSTLDKHVLLLRFNYNICRA